MQQDDLKIKYGEEMVAVIETDELFRLLNCAPQAIGFQMLFPRTLDEIWKRKKFALRYEVEYDENVKQLIPYVILRDAQNIYTIFRIASDERLVGMRSIGMGGHIDPNDLDLHGAILRELHEELVLDDNRSLDLKFKGILYIEDSVISRCHLALVYESYTDLQCIKIHENTKLSGKLVEIDELATQFVEFEGWSRYIAEALYIK